MPQDTTVAPSRFSILVPEPKTRFNMGKPEAGENAFGYKGISFQAEDHLYADIVGTVHLQSGVRMHLQAGDHWEQFAYKNMNLAANYNSTLAANGKVVVAAGAGQANFPTIPTGSSAPPWIDYNNLRLHYLVDTVATGLKELFYGEHWATQQKLDGATQKEWGKTQAPPMNDGLFAEFDEVLTGLGFDRAAHTALFDALLTPMRWSPDYVSAQGKSMPWNWASSEFKFLASGDPYAASAVMGEGIPRVLTKVMAYFLQTGVLVRRFSDTLELLIPSIMEFEVIARIRGLVTAARAFNDLLLKVDPAQWKAFNPKDPNSAWVNVRKHSFESFEEGVWQKTTAELTTKPEPFSLSSLRSFELEILDKEGGTPRIVNLSAQGTPATLTLHLEGKFTAIRLVATGNGTLVLDGTSTWYSAQEKAWKTGEEEGLPEGFAFDKATGMLTKGGELFEASEPSPNLAFEDRTFSEGSLALVVDGSPHGVPGLAALNSVSAGARASALAATLTGVGGVSATASGSSVVLTSSTLGATSSLALSTSVAAHAELGLEGEASGGGENLSAASLKEVLEGTGNFSVELKGQSPHQWLEIKHKVEGKPSYLEFAGEPATAFFGKNPASAKGTDPGQSSKDIKPLFDALFETMEGNSINALFRPVLDAVQKVVEVWGKIEETVKGLQAFLAPQIAKPHLALTAGPGGVTIATNGAVNEVGHSVTLIAAGEMTEPNKKKFVPIVEDIIHGIEVANEKLAHYLWHNPYEGALVPPGHGNLNLISSGKVNVLANEPVRVLSRDTVHVLANEFAVDAVGKIELGAHTGALVLKGTAVQIGDTAIAAGAGAHKQQATDNVVIQAATGQVVAHTNEVGVWLKEADKQAALGTRKTADGSLDTAKMHLDVKPAKVKLGDAQDALSLDGGNAKLIAGTKVALEAGQTVALEASSSGVKVNGGLDVSGVLKVTGIPVPAMAQIELAIDAKTQALRVELQAQLTALQATAETLRGAIRTADEAIRVVRDEVVPMVAASGQEQALAAAEAVRTALTTQLDAVRANLTRVEARMRGAGMADLIRQPLDRLASL